MAGRGIGGDSGEIEPGDGSFSIFVFA